MTIVTPCASSRHVRTTADALAHLTRLALRLYAQGMQQHDVADALHFANWEFDGPALPTTTVDAIAREAI